MKPTPNSTDRARSLIVGGDAAPKGRRRNMDAWAGADCDSRLNPSTVRKPPSRPPRPSSTASGVVAPGALPMDGLTMFTSTPSSLSVMPSCDSSLSSSLLLSPLSRFRRELRRGGTSRGRDPSSFASPGESTGSATAMDARPCAADL
jgi:hypothetical protein